MPQRPYPVVFFSKLFSFTHVIANPPYKKINSQSAHRLLLRSVGIEVTNFYAAFVALSSSCWRQPVS